ncbi:MAG: AMP-binding protein [Kofleriaceae bacterium]|nr:AMP-binding protein [Kofleriaceae bacterium]MCB9574243.1 AMP-binding protein [Kofleriaceae bacterium]
MIVDRLRGHVRDAAFVGRVLSRTRLLGALHPRGVSRFLRAARGTSVGPHLATMLHASNQPDKDCIVDGDRRISWRELDALANQLGHALAARGVGGGAPVAIMMPNGADYLVAQQALARVGAVAVQIGYRLKAGEVAHILGNAEPKAILVHAMYQAVMAAAIAQAGATGRMIVFDGDDLPAGAERHADVIAGQPTDRPPRARGSGDGGGGVIIYTSGTTGKPKGAARSWKQTGLGAVADMMLQVGMRQDDRQLVVCPLYHSAAPAFVAMTFSLGGTVVLMNHFDPEGALALIERERITSMLMVPTMLVRLSALPAEVRRRYDTSSLRWVMSGAAPLATEVARTFQDQFGAVLWNFYGSTETGVVTLAGPSDHVARPGTVGRALRGNEVRILATDGRPCAPGEVGELYARNSMLIAGYHRNPDATAASMRDGFFSVGDLARVDADGFYYMESRKHDMVISGGVNIYPREIEDHLHTHPAVLEAAVVGVPDPEWGESLRAYVVVRPAATLTEPEVVDWCRRGLADYKRPRQVVFLGELPRNPTGKVLKRELRQRP